MLKAMPDEMIVAIFKEMRVKDALALSAAYKPFYKLLHNSENGLWKYYLKRDFREAAARLIVKNIDMRIYRRIYLYERDIKPTIENLIKVVKFIRSSLTDMADILTRLSKVTAFTPLYVLSDLYHDTNNAIRSNTDRSSTTPLCLAALCGKTEVVLALLALGANVDEAAMFHESPLFFAAQEGHKVIICALIKKGAKVNAANTNGTTPLHQAVLRQNENSIDIVQILIAADANVNAANIDGNTPLHWAAGNSTPDIVYALIKAGANVVAKNHIGYATPLNWANSRDRADNAAVICLAIHKNASSAVMPLILSRGQAQLTPAPVANHSGFMLPNIV